MVDACCALAARSSRHWRSPPSRLHPLATFCQSLTSPWASRRQSLPQAGSAAARSGLKGNLCTNVPQHRRSDGSKMTIRLSGAERQIALLPNAPTSHSHAIFASTIPFRDRRASTAWQLLQMMIYDLSLRLPLGEASTFSCLNFSLGLPPICRLQL